MAKSGIGGRPLRHTKKLVMGEPQELSGFKVQPVARLTSWHWTSRNGSAGGGVMQLSPTEVVVQDANGGEQRLALPNPHRGPLLGMLAGGIGVAGVCSVVMLVVSLIGVKRLVGR